MKSKCMIMVFVVLATCLVFSDVFAQERKHRDEVKVRVSTPKVYVHLPIFDIFVGSRRNQNLVWVPGHWEYYGRHRGYVWIDGHWEEKVKYAQHHRDDRDDRDYRRR